MRRVRVVEADQGTALGVVEVAETAATRMRGLLGRDGLTPGNGLVLRPCAMIHTWFMRFPIDVLFTDKDGVVLALANNLAPFRLVWGGWRAKQAIEFPAGTLRRSGIAPGVRLRLEPV